MISNAMARAESRIEAKAPSSRRVECQVRPDAEGRQSHAVVSFADEVVSGILTGTNVGTVTAALPRLVMRSSDSSDRQSYRFSHSFRLHVEAARPLFPGISQILGRSPVRRRLRRQRARGLAALSGSLIAC